MSDVDAAKHLLNAAKLISQDFQVGRQIHNDSGIPVKIDAESVPVGIRQQRCGFIGSSSGAKSIAWALQHALSDDFDITVWDQMAFSPSSFSMEALENVGRETDFAILVVTPDDFRLKGSEVSIIPRDNVIFEIGYFFGLLGRERVFLVSEKEHRPQLPSDLFGITQITFRLHGNGKLPPSIGPAATQIRHALNLLQFPKFPK
jgi:CRP/FNR family transcriptional regulator, cyclic AMP receptor protein